MDQIKKYQQRIVEEIISLGIEISTLKYNLNFRETGEGLERICRDKLEAEESKFILPEELRDYFETGDLGDVRRKIPFEKGEGVYIPFASNGEGNLGVLYLKNSLISGLKDKEKKQLMLFLSRMGGMILAKTKDIDILREQSRYDGLTGLLRKEDFFEEWDLERRAQRLEGEAKKEDSYSVIMIDIDDFKKYNDSYGHVQGDRALAAVGKLLRNIGRRQKDRTVRYGGEEFLVALGNTDEKGARALAERITKGVESLVLDTSKANENGEVYDKGPSRITVSAGYSTYPALSSSIDSLIADADRALYDAKKQGKNRVAGYSESKI